MSNVYVIWKQIDCLQEAHISMGCTGAVAEWWRVGLVIQCLHWGRGSFPTPGVYSAAIPLGKGFTVPSFLGWDLKEEVPCL